MERCRTAFVLRRLIPFLVCVSTPKKLLIALTSTLLLVGCSGNAVARELSDETLIKAFGEAWEIGQKVGMMKAACALHADGDISTKDAKVFIDKVLKIDVDRQGKEWTLKQHPGYDLI